MSKPNLYRTTLRPASSVTLPKGVGWEFVECPRELAHVAEREGKPVSQHRFGVISTRRALTEQELAQFDIVEV